MTSAILLQDQKGSHRNSQPFSGDLSQVGMAHLLYF